MTTIPGFLTKTYEIFNTPEYTDCCGWGNNGSTIVIKKIEQFSKSVLPKYFKHSNFQSFVRQLNMYDFRKTVQDPNHGEFQHPNFRQDRPELLPNIKRKAHHKSSESSKKSFGVLLSEASEYSGTTGAAGSNVPLLYSETAQAGSLKGQQTFDFKEEGTVNDSEQTGMDGSRHQGLRDELEVRLLNVEQESARVTSENATLKQLIMESRHKQAVMQDKMERILKTLYNVFMGGGNSNNLSISTNSAIVPAPTRSSLGPQMMENLLFRLDSLQSYGLRMNSDIANTPGGVDIGSIFGEEDTVPLSAIAEDMTMLVTSSRNGKNAVGNSNFNENAGAYGGGTSAVNTGHVLNNGSRNNQDGRHFTDSDNFSCIQGNSGLGGLPISQMNSFDTMASRVSAPNLVSLHEMSLRKAGDPSADTSEGLSDGTKSGGEVFGGGSLMRQKSIYPGQTDEYPRGGGGGGIGPGVPLDRQDSDTFSWSSLFSMTSVDGYGLNASSSSSDRNYAAPGSQNNTSPSMKTKIKVELNQDEKHMKRGIAELGSLSGDPNYSSIDKNSEIRENSFRRQRISSSYPPLNPHSSGPGTPLPSLASQGATGTMDPPSLDKPDASEVFYGRHNESNSLTRNDSLELTIATLLKSMDSFDANNNNSNNNNAAT